MSNDESLSEIAPTDAAEELVIPDDLTSPSEVDALRAVKLLDHPELPEVFYKVRHSKKRAFLLALTMTPNISVACRVAGVHRTTTYAWGKEGDQDYNAALAVAEELGIKAAEAEAWKRGTEGSVEDVYGSLGQGLGSGVVGQKRVKSDTMLIFMLKGAAPQKYRENTSHEISGPGGGPLQIEAVRSIIVDPKVIDQ